MSTPIKGESLILYLWDEVSAYEPIACLTSNSLSQTRSIIESQTKCDPGTVIKTPGVSSYDISFEGEAIVTEAGKQSHAELFTYINSAVGTTQTWKMDNGQSGSPAYYGQAILADLSLDAPAGDEVTTFSGSLSGSGLIVILDPNA
jgi:predicted secreted protein|tara:strand:+ start:1120 stop:1557 length:438 start_codon:yes stop_codon:yes gene_type:complete